MKLSLVREFDDGRQLRLLLDPDSQPRDAESAFALFIDAVKQIWGSGWSNCSCYRREARITLRSRL
jgi:hypothetical protein